MTGKVCVVTGATAGIGYETALALAAKGATVALMGRSAEKGAAATEQIKAVTGNRSIFFFKADMGLQASIREAGQAIREQFPVIDVLVNNHGTFFSRRTLTPEGFETVFAVNHLAFFLLTHLLYPALRKAPDARIINVSSGNHYDTVMHFDDLGLGKKYTGFRAYAQSKLANVLFTYELERRKPDSHICVNVLHPGLVNTDIGLKHNHWLFELGWKLRRTLWPSLTPAQGAQTSIYLASSDEVKGKSGLYWERCQPKQSATYSYNKDYAARLWEISEEWCGMEDFFPK